MVQQLMQDWIMDPEGKKFGGGKKLVTLVLFIILFYTNLCLV